MTNNLKEYMSSADAARDLGLSVASVQKMVDVGELAAVRTQGGHRRIFVDSINKYRATHGYYMPPPPANMICIMHDGKNLDPMLMQAFDSETVKILSHPLDLLGLEKIIDVLFIDANNSWLETTPKSLIEGLKNNYTLFIYNTNKLSQNSPLRGMNPAHFISNEINYQFMSGYLMGRKMVQNFLMKR